MKKIIVVTVVASVATGAFAGWGDIGKAAAGVGAKTAIKAAAAAQEQKQRERQAKEEERQKRVAAEERQRKAAEQEKKEAAVKAATISNLIKDVPDEGHFKFLGYKLGSEWSISTKMGKNKLPGNNGEMLTDSVAAIKKLQGIRDCSRKLFRAPGKDEAILVSVEGKEDYDADFVMKSHSDLKNIYEKIVEKYSGKDGFSTRKITGSLVNELEYEVCLGNEVMNLSVMKYGSCSRIVTIELYDSANKKMVEEIERADNAAKQKAIKDAKNKELEDAI